MPYRTYRPNFASLQRKYQVPTFTPEDETRRALETQKANLETRLSAAGGDEVDGRNILKKALNLDEEQGLLMSTFEILNRPRQAVQGLLTEGPEGALAGFTGNLEQSPVEVLDKLGVVDKRNIDGVGEFALNIAGGMAMDPLTYLGGIGGVLKKTGVIGSGKYKARTISQIRNKSAEVSSAITTDPSSFIGKLDKKTGITKYTTPDGKFTIYTAEDFKKLNEINAKAIKDKVSAGTLKKSAEAEQLTAKELSESFKDMFKESAENFDFIANDVSDVGSDVGVFYKTLGGDGTDYMVEVGSIEVKDFIRKAADQAHAISFTFNKAAFNKTGELILSSGRKKMSQETLGRINDILNKMGYRDNAVGTEPLQNVMSKITNAAKTKTGKTSFKIENIDEVDEVIKRISKGELSSLNDVFKMAMKEEYAAAGKEYISAITPEGQVLLARTSDILDNVDFNAYFALDRGGLKLLNKMGKNFTVDDFQALATPEVKEEFFSNFIENHSSFSEIVEYKKEAGILVEMIDRAALSEKAYLNIPARFAKNAGAKLNTMFNASAGTSVYFQGQLLRLGGKSRRLVNENLAAVDAIERYFKEQGIEGSGRLLNQLAEGGVRRGVDGAIEVSDRIYNSSDLLGDAATSLYDGRKAFLPSIKDDITARNLEAQLNRILKDAGMQVPDGSKFLNIFRAENNSAYIEFTSDAIENNADFFSILMDKKALILDEKIDFGKAIVSDEALTLFNNHEAKANEFIAIRDKMSDILQNELGFQGISEELAGKMGYMRHKITDQGKAYLRSKATASENVYTKGVDVLKKRNYMGTSEEVSQGFRTFMELDYDVLSTDGYESMRELIKITSQKMEQKNVLQAILENSPVDADSFFQVVDDTKESVRALGPYYRKLDGGFKTEFKNMFASLDEGTQAVVEKHFADLGLAKGKILTIHKSAYNVLEKLEKTYVDLPDAVRLYDKFMNMWKSLTLVTPGFHMRNFFGNHTNMYIAGMNTADITAGFTRTVSDLSQYEALKTRVFSEGGINSLTPDERVVYERVKYYFESGISQKGRGVRDLESINKTVYDKLAKDPNKLKQFYNDTIKMNYDVAEKIDDYSRYNLYQWALTKGPQPGLQDLINQGAPEYVVENLRRANAAKTVSESLFDYQHLTSFERNVMKRLFPFYTFMKNNAIFQAKSLLNKPGKYAALGRAYDFWNEDLAGIETDQLPDYMQDRMWLPLPMRVNKNDEEAISFLKLNLTPSDFTQLVRNPFRQGVVSVSAPIKLAFELGTGRDSFTGRPLEGFPGEQRRLDADVGALPMLRDERGTMALSANPYVQKILNETGLRVPLNYVSIAFDGLDYITGRTTRGDMVSQLGERLGLTGTQTVSNLELTRLYQDLEQLRNKRRLFEQEMGEPLPSLDELGLRP